MDFDKPKVYGDTFISDGLVFLVVNDGYWILEKTSTSICTFGLFVSAKA